MYQEELSRIYSGIFKIVDDKVKKEDIYSGCHFKAAHKSLGTAPRVIDYTAYEDLEGEEFLEAMYFVLYQRLPSEASREKYALLSREDIIRNITSEGAYAVRKLKVINGPFGDITPGLLGRIIGLASVVTNSVALRNLAKKMPKGIQDKIRRLFC